MTDLEKCGSWIEKVADGGLPRVLAGPAGVAISRLVGASVEIPAAWLEGIAQGARDKAAARSLLSGALAEEAARRAIGNPEIVDRAMQSMLGRAYRSQTNREAVAAIAVGSLEEHVGPEEGDGPTGDWMNKFERSAEDASSEELRLLFGRILAGEIRSPGSISVSTLHVLSLFDSEVADLAVRAMKQATIGGIAFTKLGPEQLNVEQAVILEQAGFWTSGKTYQIHPSDESGHSILDGPEGRRISGGNARQFTEV